MPFIYFMYIDAAIVVDWDKANQVIDQYGVCLETA
jgi:hypothetical protein